MEESQLRFDQEQLEKILGEFRPGRKPAVSLESALQTFQLLSILAAGIWVLFNYFSFEKEQRTLAIAQEQIVKEQQALSLEQSKLLAQNQRDVAEVTLKQQQFTLSQQIRLADSAKDKAQLDVRALELENSMKTIQIKNLKQSSLKFDTRMDLRKMAARNGVQVVGYWTATLHIAVQNVSKAEVKIDSAEIASYIGCLRPADSSSPIRRFNPPDEKDGPIDWREINKTAYRSIAAANSPGMGNGLAGYTLGGPAFGRLKEEEGLEYNPVYEVLAPEGGVIGFLITMHVDDGGSPWVWQFVERGFTDDIATDVAGASHSTPSSTTEKK